MIIQKNGRRESVLFPYFSFDLLVSFLPIKKGYAMGGCTSREYTFTELCDRLLLSYIKLYDTIVQYLHDSSQYDPPQDYNLVTITLMIMEPESKK